MNTVDKALYDHVLEHNNRLFLALVKMYDNYLTPLRRKINCWKYKVNKRVFLLGMTITDTSFDPNTPEKKYDISYYLPMKYWNNAHVIELKEASVYDDYSSDDVLERLMLL